MKLSEFADEKAIAVVADLLTPIGNIIKSKATAEARRSGGTSLEFAAAILKNNAADVKDMLAILSGEDPAKYHCTAATVLFDTMNMLADPDLIELFGLQSKTAASAGSASENTEAQES